MIVERSSTPCQHNIGSSIDFSTWVKHERIFWNAQMTPYCTNCFVLYCIGVKKCTWQGGRWYEVGLTNSTVADVRPRELAKIRASRRIGAAGRPFELTSRATTATTSALTPRAVKLGVRFSGRSARVSLTQM